MLGGHFFDSSIEQSKKAGGITKVSSVDQKHSSILMFGKTCTMLKGS